MVAEAAAEATLEGVVERVVFTNEENGWSVLRLQLADRAEPVTAVGNLLGVQPGERLRLDGEWVQDRRYGRQFQARSYLTLRPETLTGIRKYLGSGLVPGIGRVMAERLVDRFGLDTLEVIEHHPERLSQVEGIGPVRSDSIRKAWLGQREIRDLMVFLQSHGISSGQGIRIYKRYGAEAVNAVKRNPYRLASEVWGIGFRTADRIASSLGILADSPLRAAAGLLHALERASENGHLFLPREQLISAARELLQTELTAVEQALTALTRQGAVVAETVARDLQPSIYLPPLYAAESGLAQRVWAILRQPPPRLAADIDAGLELFARQLGSPLADEQRRAIRRAFEVRMLIITGGPGTGKTTLVRCIVQLLSGARRKVLLAAPTGRAAKRLAEATGREAATVHRLLEFEPRGMTFQRHRGRPLEADTVVVDEASMLDCAMAHAVLGAVPDSGQLLLVGDADQLPSVGPGRVLDDLIRCQQVPVVRLSRIFRQAAASLIVRNAHRIRRGEMPLLDHRGQRSADFFFIERGSPEEVLETVRQVVTERIPRSFRLDPTEEIQVLTPMRRGPLGAENLNAQLQALLNPGGRPAPAGLRIGDRVMQLRNNYELEVFNGDIGRIAAFDPVHQRLSVAFDERSVTYEPSDFGELALAYASSVHKAQGSEYPCVVMPLHTHHRLLLQRNLLYTALTRARRLMVLVGSRRAVALAVRNAEREARFSHLAGRITEPG